jgi:hypothetical protein
MSNGLVAFMLGAGVGAWVYSVMMRRTGSNTTNSLVVAGIAGLFGFVAMLVLLSFIKNMLG